MFTEFDMPIPRDILDVERPKNTVVIVYGVNKDKYAVRQRVGCKRVNGKNIPLNGPTIGHIINGKYVPKNQNLNINLSKKKDNPEFNLDLKDWANIMLSNELFSGILEELKELYSEDDAHRIFAASFLNCTLIYLFQRILFPSFLKILVNSATLLKNSCKKEPRKLD